MEKGKTSKYLKYAIGEIILVVIGILIALQINNWNENRKSERQETKLLQQIKSDIETNNTDLETLITTLETNEAAMDSVFHYFNKKTYKLRGSIFLSLIHRKSFFNNVNSGYKLIGSGLGSIVSNDSLLNEIVQVYEVDFDNVLKFQSQMHQHIDNQLFPLTNTLFEVSNSYKLNFKDADEEQTNFYKPIDFETLQNNHQYKNTLLQLKQNYKNRLSHSKKVKVKTDKLLKKLTIEINSNVN